MRHDAGAEKISHRVKPIVFAIGLQIYGREV
jgi:hypothetical protein